MANKNSIQYTVVVAVLLCLVCSVVVSAAAVLLRPAQQENRALDVKRNILASAGMLQPGESVEAQFERVTPRLIDLETGKFTDAVDIDSYDQRDALSDSQLSRELPKDADLAKIGRIEKYAKVYQAQNEQGEPILILPVRGYGLWSTMYGFLALGPDYNTVVGLGFYSHGETPGLGGEIDNPRWKALWPGKQIYGEGGEVSLDVVKGSVDAGTPNAEYKVDGLSGATLTSRGVDNMIDFWLGENGYRTFIENLKNGEA